jgi:uncharacterized protein (TIGR03663 family)
MDDKSQIENNQTTEISSQEVVAVEKHSDDPTWLDRSLASLVTWDWEKTAWLALLIVAAVIRLVALDNRTASHDESEHAWFAYNLYAGKGYEHSPIYHGPFIYHVMALFYLIFGASDVTARVPTALFGLGIVAMLWFTRRWLGKYGAFLAAALITFSPALLHYSRHTRHDIYELFWAVVLIVAIFRYLENRLGKNERWLYLAAAALSLALASKEDAFIHGAALGGFLLLIIAFRWFGARLGFDVPEEAREAPVRMAWRDAGVLAGLVGVALLGSIVFKLAGMASFGNSGTPVQTIAALVTIVLPPLVAVGLAVWYGLRRAGDGSTAPVPLIAGTSATMDVVILLATLILPWISPFAIKAFGYDPLDYTTGIFSTLSLLAAFIGISAVIGLSWSFRRWLISAALFTALFVVLFTGFFTNGKGIATGVIGSLGYWISQQEVARGSQPWYYYFIIVPLYEFLPLILSIPVMIRALVQRNRSSLILLAIVVVLMAGWIAVEIRAPQSVRESDLLHLALGGGAIATALLALAWGGLNRYPRNQQLLVALLPFLVFFSWVAYSIAGEKMPWIVTSITLPMCLAGGWWLGTVVERVDWRAFWRRGDWLIVVLMVPLLAALAALVRTRPFQDRTIEGLGDTGQWIAALLVALVVLYLFIRQIQKSGWRQSRRVIGLTLTALLGVWLLRTTYVMNFINPNNVTEYLYYAHGGPDPLTDMRDIETLSRRTVGDKQLKVAYDDDASWPFNWYLRDWPNALYFGANPSRESFADAPVALVGSKNLDKARPYLQRDYYEFDHRLIWWPDEGYKNTSLEKIRLGLTDPAKRKEFLDVVLWRKYPTPLSQWPLVHRYSLFVRKDVANQLWDFGAAPVAAAAVVDPYAQGVRDLASQQIVGGGPGTAQGQLSFPRNAAVAADGTLYVADSGNHRIQVFAPDGTFLREWGSSCELYADGQPGCVDPDGDGPLELGDGQLREPWGLVVAVDGTVYVADTWNHRVVAFDSQGAFLNKWGTFVTTGDAGASSVGFWGPRAIAIDGAGNLYVTDTGNKRIEVFDKAGAYLGQYGTGGVVEGSFDEPVGLALMPKGDGLAGGTLYVADTWNRRVQVFDVTFEGSQPVFSFVKAWPIEGWNSQSVVNKPYLAVDSQGVVYATDPEMYRVLVFDKDGAFKATFGQYGNDAKTFALPNGIAIGPNDTVYVADADNHRIMVFPAVR